jgi:Family of unknown function (DUF5677)
MKNIAKLAFIRDHYIDAVIGAQIYPKVTSVPYIDNPLAVVSDYFLRKATKTFDAMCVLCEVGFAEDAQVLGRTIFELCVRLHTIASADSIEQRRRKAESFIYDAERQRIEKLKELMTLKEKGKCLSWIAEIEALNPDFETVEIPDGFIPLKNPKTMATELGDPWESWYYILYWSLSKFAHPSGLGSHTYIQEHDNEAGISRAIAVGLTMHSFLTDAVLVLLDLETLRPCLEHCVENVLTHIED